MGKHQLRIRYGSQFLNDDQQHSEMHIKAVFVHPKYDPISESNDIAVIRLANPVQPSNTVQFVQLQTEPELPAGSKLRLYGWVHHTKSNSLERLVEQLQVAQLKTISSKKCHVEQMMSQLAPTETRICAEAQDDTSERVCIVDSGAPLITQDGRLTGIVSLSSTKSCPLGIYTKVFSYLDFVNKFLK